MGGGRSCEHFAGRIGFAPTDCGVSTKAGHQSDGFLSLGTCVSRVSTFRTGGNDGTVRRLCRLTDNGEDRPKSKTDSQLPPGGFQGPCGPLQGLRQQNLLGKPWNKTCLQVLLPSSCRYSSRSTVPGPEK